MPWPKCGLGNHLVAKYGPPVFFKEKYMPFLLKFRPEFLISYSVCKKCHDAFVNVVRNKFYKRTQVLSIWTKKLQINAIQNKNKASLSTNSNSSVYLFEQSEPSSNTTSSPSTSAAAALKRQNEAQENKQNQPTEFVFKVPLPPGKRKLVTKRRFVTTMKINKDG